jgi:uncharacterized caspase-like protein
VQVNDGQAISRKPFALSDGVDTGYLDVAWPQGVSNYIRLRVNNPEEKDLPVRIHLSWQASMSFRPKLFLLAVGVSHYKEKTAEDKDLDLPYAALDAQNLVQAFKGQKGLLFQDVLTETDGPIINEAATRKDLFKRLSWIHKNAETGSLVLVTLSGHGKLGIKDRFFFLPHTYDPKEELASTGFSWEDFNNYLEDLPCAVVVVMDTCHSGAIGVRGDSEKVVTEALSKLSTQKGLVVMAACRGHQSAFEHPEWEMGTLSLALLEAIQGERRYTKKRATRLPQEMGCTIVTMEDLARYAKDRVKELVGDRQEVVIRQTDGIYLSHIPVAMVKR